MRLQNAFIHKSQVSILIHLAICFILISLFTLSFLDGNPWFCYHHDAQRTGYTTAIGPDIGGLRWKFDIDRNASGVLIGQGSIFYFTTTDGSSDKKLYAVKSPCQLLWQFPFSGIGSPKGLAMSADTTIYFENGQGILYAVKNGVEKWTIHTGGDSYRPWPVVGSDGKIYVGGDSLFCISPDGNIDWAYSPSSVWHTAGSPALGNDGAIYCYFFNTEDRLYALYPDGSPKWFHTLGGNTGYRPIPSVGPGGRIYVVAPNEELRCLNPVNGSIIWSYTGSFNAWEAPAIGPDTTIYLGGGNLIYAIKNGNLKWTKDIGTQATISPIIDGAGTIYSMISAGMIAINPDGTTKWTYNTGQAVYAQLSMDTDGNIYYPTYDGFFCVGLPDNEPPQITVTRPNGGEVFVANTYETIEWISSDNVGIKNHYIYYSTDGGGVWNWVAYEVPGDSQSFLWLVPNTPSDSCLIKVEACDYTNHWANDVSDSFFTISAVGVKEETDIPIKNLHGPTIITGSLLQLPEGKEWKVLDVSGREIEPGHIGPGIYFIEVQGRIERKVVKIR